MRKEFTLVSRRLSIDFLLTGKYNVLTGDSGVGKTYLLQEIRKINAANLWLNHPSFDVVACDETGDAVTTSLGEAIQSRDGDVILLDEELVSRLSRKDWNSIQESPNYFLFVVRERLPQIPYAPWNIFRLEGNKNHLKMVRVYNQSPKHIVDSSKILCEDTGTGFTIASRILQRRGYFVTSLGGNGNLVLTIRKARGPVHVLIDLCGFGSMYSSLVGIIAEYDVDICDYKSFEHEALKGLGYTDEYLDPDEGSLLRSRSEEAYYTSLLSNIIKSSYSVSYDKGDTSIANTLLTGVYKHGSTVTHGLHLAEDRMYRGLNNRAIGNLPSFTEMHFD